MKSKYSEITISFICDEMAKIMQEMYKKYKSIDFESIYIYPKQFADHKDQTLKLKTMPISDYGIQLANHYMNNLEEIDSIEYLAIGLNFKIDDSIDLSRDIKSFYNKKMSLL